MRAYVTAFCLCGLLGGALAGVYDAQAATTDAAEGGAFARMLIGAVGANALLGLWVGLVCGVLAPGVPEPLGLAGLLTGARRRFFPGPDDPLQERSFTAATLFSGFGVFVAFFAAMTRFSELALSRIQSAVLLATLVTVVALVLLTGALAVAAPARAVLARAMERFVRRFPRASPIFHPLTALAVVSLAAGLRFAAWRAHEAETWEALDLRAPAALALLLAVTLVGGARLQRSQGESVPAARTWFALLAAPIVAVLALAWGLGTERSLNALGTATGSTRFVLKVLRLPFDRDGDGFAGVLGGGDCDDDDSGIHPGAVDVPANGKDEDCDGEDLRAAPRVSPTTPDVAGPGPGSGEKLNVVLITIDSLRADHLHAAGYARETSPAMDALAAESVVFTQARSTSSKTPTAMPSLLTGRYPGELIRDGEHFTTYGAENVFLAEVLHEKGYVTSAYPSHWYFLARYGLGQGFETWQPFLVSERKMEKVATAEPVVVAAVKHLENVLLPNAERPFFLWVHILDPHKNYIAHPDTPVFGAGLDPAGGPPPSAPADGEAESATAAGAEPIDRYDHEIRYVDTWVGRLIEALSKRPDWERTLVVLTSDHGEAFGEHGYKYHGFGLHEHQLRVPLMFRLPKVFHRTVDTPVSLVDVAPTLLDLLHIVPDASMGLRGRSLAPALRGEALEPAPQYAETPKGPYNPERAAYLEMPWKLLYDAEGDLYQLFNLQADPGEKDDRYRADPEHALHMRDALKRFRAERMSLRGADATAPLSGPPTPHGH